LPPDFSLAARPTGSAAKPLYFLMHLFRALAFPSGNGRNHSMSLEGLVGYLLSVRVAMHHLIPGMHMAPSQIVLSGNPAGGVLQTRALRSNAMQMASLGNVPLRMMLQIRI
jgi:hypothetical protein